MAVKANSEKTWSCTVLERWRQNFMWPRLPRRQTAEFAYFCMELVASSLVGVVGQNFWISWSCWCRSRLLINNVQVSLHPRGVRAKEGCSTEQSALVSVLKYSSVQSRSVSPSFGQVLESSGAWPDAQLICGHRGSRRCVAPTHRQKV